jgi:iron-sulfur cluster repair protein YtfE (RIC family)
MIVSRSTDAIRRHHRELHDRVHELAERLEKLPARPGPADRQELESGVALLKKDLQPHIRAEERHLYPACESLLREHVSATAILTAEHRMIESEMSVLIQEMERARGCETLTREQLALLRRRSLRLATMLLMHATVEEEIVLRVAEDFLTLEQIDELVRSMHESAK